MQSRILILSTVLLGAALIASHSAPAAAKLCKDSALHHRLMSAAHLLKVVRLGGASSSPLLAPPYDASREP
jgi:hypothetical protein